MTLVSEALVGGTGHTSTLIATQGGQCPITSTYRRHVVHQNDPALTRVIEHMLEAAALPK